MDYDDNELLDIAYQLIVATDDEAAKITDSLNNRQLNIVLMLKEQIEKRWSNPNAFS